MKTATITFHTARSYGAVLQAYSLQHFLERNGIENKIIDYTRNRKSVFRLYHRGTGLKTLMSNVDVFIHRRELLESLSGFSEFVDKNLNKTREYNSFEDLKNDPPDADVYIAGSDQIWNIQSRITREFFLDFGSSEVKRISYAASMGNSTVPKENENQLEKLLERFSAISVREEESCNTLMPFYKKTIQPHIDPTFLTPADEWRKLEKPIPGLDEPYILCFCLYRPEWRNEELRRLHNRTGKPIVLLDSSGLRNIYHNKQVRCAGPAEFLWLIDHADSVITTSFHGVAFSCIFGKPLYAVVNPSAPERIQNLTRVLGIEQVIVTSFGNEPYSYDRKLVESRINEQTELSKEYLFKWCKQR